MILLLYSPPRNSPTDPPGLDEPSLCLLSYLEKGIQTLVAQGRSTKTISMIMWTRTSRLSIKISLSLCLLSIRCPPPPRGPMATGMPRSSDAAAPYRVTSLIRNRPPPQGHPRAPGMVLL